MEEQSAAATVPSIIDSGATSVTYPMLSDNATMVTTLSKFEAALAAADKNIRELEKKGEQDKKGGGGANPCKHCKRCKQTKSYEGIEEKNCFLNTAASKWRPPWAKKKLEENNVDYKMELQELGLIDNDVTGADTERQDFPEDYPGLG